MQALRAITAIAAISAIALSGAAAAHADYFPDFSVTVIGGGVTVYTARMGEVPLVTLRLIVDAGSVYDAPGREGISRLTASLLTGGAGALSGDQLLGRIESMGGTVSVEPGRDVVIIEGSFLAGDIEAGIEIMKMILASQEFSPAEAAKKKRDIISEISGRRYYHLATDIFLETVLPGRYAHPVSGYSETVEKLTVEDIRAFYSNFYTPSRTALVITGDIDEASAVELAGRHFGEWEAGGPGFDPPPRPQSKEALPPPVLVIDQPGITQSEIRIGQRGPGRGSGDYYPLTLGSKILGQGRSSQLYRLLREQNHLVYSVRSAAGYFRDAGYFGIYTYTGNDNVRRVIEEAISVLDRFGRELPEEAELEGAKNYFQGALPFLMETSGQIAGRLSDIHIFGLDPGSFRAFADSLEALTAERVRDSVKRHFLSGRRVIVVLTDYSQTEKQFEGLGPVRVISRPEAERGLGE